MARTLLESVCKSVLDDIGQAYEDAADLPRLYRVTAEALTLAPSQHTEQVFKQILGGCTSVVRAWVRFVIGWATDMARVKRALSPRHGMPN